MKAWFLRVLIVSMFVHTAVYAIRPIVSYKALALGAGGLELGLIAAAFASLSLLVAVPIGRWVDRWGEPIFVLIGSLLITSASTSLLLIDSLIALAASQAVLGVGHIMSVVGMQALIAGWGDPNRRDARFGVFTVVVSCGQLAGPALGGFIAGGALTSAMHSHPGGQDTHAVFIAVTVVTLGGALAAATLMIPPSRASADALPPAADSGRPQAHSTRSSGATETLSSRRAVGRVLGIPSMPHAMIASLTVLSTIDILAVYLPAYGEATGLSVETVGLLLAVRAGASMTSRVLMLPLLRLLGRKSLLIMSIIVPAAALGAFPFVDPVWLLYILVALAGFGLGLGQPVTLAWVAHRAPADVRGTAIGVRLTGNRLGQMLLPAMVGGVAGSAGVTAVFASMAGMLALSAAAVFAADFEQDEAAELSQVPGPPN